MDTIPIQKPHNHPVNFKYAICSCNVTIKELKTKKSTKLCKCEIKQIK